MAGFVLVKYGSRNILVPIKNQSDTESDYDALLREFMNIAQNDPHFKKKIHLMPIFTYYHTDFKAEVELYSGCSTANIKEVKLTFRAPYDTPEKQQVLHVSPEKLPPKALFPVRCKKRIM